MSSHDADTSSHLGLLSELSVEVHDSLDVVARELRVAVPSCVHDVLLQKILADGVLVGSGHHFK